MAKDRMQQIRNILSDVGKALKQTMRLVAKIGAMHFCVEES